MTGVQTCALPILLVSARINRHGTGTVDPVILAPTHEDGAYGDVMEMLPLVSCVMSHFKRELSSEHFNNWIMLVHLRVGANFRNLYRRLTKIDRLDGVVANVPINVCCPVFNEIPPIWDCQWGQPEWGQWGQNDGHWLLRTQTWVISTKE